MGIIIRTSLLRRHGSIFPIWLEFYNFFYYYLGPIGGQLTKNIKSGNKDNPNEQPFHTFTLFELSRISIIHSFVYSSQWIQNFVIIIRHGLPLFHSLSPDQPTHVSPTRPDISVLFPTFRIRHHRKRHSKITKLLSAFPT